LYRKYKINAKASDDYEALKEVIIKRLKPKDSLSSSSSQPRLNSGDSEGYKSLPDLLILD